MVFLFCKLMSNFAFLKIRNVRPLSPLSGCVWYHSHAFFTKRLKHKMLSRMSEPKCILSLVYLKAAGGRMLNCLIFMQ